MITGSARTAGAALLSTAVVVAGCGGSGGANGTSAQETRESSDRQAVANVLSDLQNASRAGDGRRICNEIFTPKLATSVTRSSRARSCAKEVKAELFSPQASITVENVDVTSPSDATATVKEQNGNTSTVFLVKQSGRWRIRSVQPT